MDHEQTLDDKTVERYLLGELPAAEAEDFERHYFECQECAFAVESGQVFIENAREVFKEERAPARDALPRRVQEKQGFWSRPAFALPWAAAAVFGAIALYEGAVLIPRTRQSVEVAQALPSFQLGGATRGEGLRVAVPAGTPWFSLWVDIPPGQNLKDYRCVLTTDDRTVFTFVTPPPAEGFPINIMVPTKDLKPGKFNLTVYGLEPDGRQRDILSSNSFDFQFK